MSALALAACPRCNKGGLIKIAPTARVVVPGRESSDVIAQAYCRGCKQEVNIEIVKRAS